MQKRANFWATAATPSKPASWKWACRSAATEINGRAIAFVAIERSDAVTIHDITDPTNIRLLDTVLLNPALVRADQGAELEPEGIEFISATNQVVVSNPEGSSISLINLVVE
jgi:hypothetical protein